MDRLEPTATSAAPDAPAPTAPPPPRALAAGSSFGGYQLGRVLGRGGMGIVYEAEEIDSGRRVALKVLQQRLDDDRDRERFQREGRLAASIDHQHCVFVFGATEVDGVPAIAMELMQGTLADRVAADGPLAPTAAVDAVLQLIDGLRAAQAAGILHRDVKPSNCFVDADGVVKIGDFGISRSMRPADDTTQATRGRFAATPTYASPEQLSGKPLDIRADIYSLGATLYDLLTGVRPFARTDLMTLLMAVANEMPRAPHDVAPEVPKGLSEIVLRCLAKQPEQRFPDYDAVAAALEPYASWSPTPATIGRRLLAGVVDTTLLTFFMAPVLVVLMVTPADGFDRGTWAIQLTVAAIVSLVYYALCERRWGATAGKALMGLIVVDVQSRPLGIAAAFTRAGLFLGPTIIGSLAAVASAPATLDRAPSSMPAWAVVQWATYWTLWVGLFATARRRNGYAGLHDLASRSRVVTAAARATRAASAIGRPAGPRVPVATGAAAETRGGFVLLPGSIEGRDGWRPGYDPRLGRPVWIRDLRPGTAPVSPARAALARPTRLRWLAGRRTDREAWDVYEAVAGVPLPQALAGTPGWGTARRWIADLARELAAQDPDDRPPLGLDRVWLLDSGHVKLLDDPTEDQPGAAADRGAFLDDVMARLRRVAPVPWPRSATSLVADALSTPLAALSARLDALQRARAAMTPVWRGVSIACAAAFAIFMIAISITGSALMNLIVLDETPDQRAVLGAIRLLRKDAVAAHWGFAPDNWRRLSDRDRDAIELFLAYRHGPALSTARQQLPPIGVGLYKHDHTIRLDEDEMAIVARVLRRAPVQASDGAAALANPRVRAILQRSLDEPPTMAEIVAFAAVGFFAINAVVAVLASIAGRSVWLRLLGFDILAADGTRASRLRVTFRALIAWSPVLVLVLVWYVLDPFDEPAVGRVLIPTCFLVFFAGAGFAIANPVRGIQDRLSGTWIVPR
jgi:eukaryotic-like serine/threonine-protein kinase